MVQYTNPELCLWNALHHFQQDWLISIYDIISISQHQWFHVAQLVGASHQYREVTGSNPVYKSWHFQPSKIIHNCINCFHNWENHSLLDFTSAVQHMKYFIYNFTFIPHGLLRTHKWPATNVSGFIAQLVRAITPVSEGRGFKPCWSPDVFRLLDTQLHKLHS